MTLPKIAIIGECMIEMQKAGPESWTQAFGGDTLNTAVYLKRMLGDKVSVSYLTGLGTDFFSKQMLDIWANEGLDTSKVSILDNKIPGLYFINLDSHGERTFTYWRNDAAAKYWMDNKTEEELEAFFFDFDVLYLSGISLAILSPATRAKLTKVLTKLKAKGKKVAFDNNFRPRLWTSREEAQEAYKGILALADFALLTFDDEQALWGDKTPEDCLARNEAYGISELLVKMGKDPCIVKYQGKVSQVPATIVKNVVDTTAAGDSFSAGYLSGRFAGLEPEAAVSTGHALAGTVIQHKGAVIPYSAMQNLVFAAKN